MKTNFQVRETGFRFIVGRCEGGDPRLRSWPHCPRRVCFEQYKPASSGERTWGSLTFDAKAFGHFIRESRSYDESIHVDDLHFIEWLEDADQSADEIFMLPRSWHYVENLAQTFMRENSNPVFCLSCNKTYPFRECLIGDDPNSSKAAYLYDRTNCPEGHTLIETLRTRRIIGPSMIKGMPL